MIEDNGDHGNPASQAYHPEYPDGAQLIADERERQTGEKGYTSDGDDRHADGELLECARLIVGDLCSERDGSCEIWPLQRAGHVRNKYHADPVRRLTIAGALIAAEIDRLIRAELRKEATGG